MNDSKRKNVLVTGGAGYVGSVLVPHLLEQGYAVTIFDKLYFKKRPIENLLKQVKLIEGDIRTPPKNLFQNIHSVIHLAALSNDPTAEFNPIANREINTDGTKIIAIMAKDAGVKRFVFASSCSIYDCGLKKDIKIKNETTRVYPKNPYSSSKYFAEKELFKLADATFTPVILRKGTIYGYSPRMRYDLIINTMVRDALRFQKLHIFCRGRQWRPLISIEDVARAYVLALQAPTKLVSGKIINIAADNYQVKTVAKEVQRIFKDSFNMSISLEYLKDRKIDRSYRVSMKRAEKLLGFYPTHTIDVSVRSLVLQILKYKKLQQFDNPLYYNIEQMKPILSQMAPLSSRK